LSQTVFVIDIAIAVLLCIPHFSQFYTVRHDFEGMPWFLWVGSVSFLYTVFFVERAWFSAKFLFV